MKRRMVTAVIVMLFLTGVSLLMAGNIDLLLTGGKPTPQPMLLLLRLTTSTRALLMFLLFIAASVLFILWSLYGKSYLNYKSDMYEVVPNFKIPMPDGQGQYGTAWWLPKDSYSSAYDVVNTASPIKLSSELTELYERERKEIPNVRF